MNLLYVVTFADGSSRHDENHYQRRNVSEDALAAVIVGYQRRGQRIVSVAIQS